MCGLLLFVVALALEHLLATGLGPRRHQISEYANGRYGWFMTVGFCGWTAALTVTALVVRERFVGACFAVAGLAVATLTVFPTQTVAGRLPPGIARSLEGQIHDRSVLVLTGALVMAALAQVADRRQPPAHRAAVLSVVLAGIGSSVALLAIGDPASGLRQRVLVLAAVAFHGCVLARGVGCGATRSSRLSHGRGSGTVGRGCSSVE